MPRLPAHRQDGDPERVALVFPGVAYTPSMPLLAFARAVLAQHGWTVQEIWWFDQPDPPSVEWPSWVDETARRAVAAESAVRLLFVGKSLGSLAMPLAAERALPGIWLTPLLGHEVVGTALPRLTGPSLLVGGTADPTWDVGLAASSGHAVHEVEGGDHGLRLPGDAVASARALVGVVQAMEEFVGTR